MTYFPVVLEQIGTFVIYACMGVALVKCHVLGRDGLTLLSQLITKLLLPLLIFTNTINGATREDFLHSLSIIAIAAVLYVVLFALASAMTALCGLKGTTRNVYRACVMFGNCGFMGIPIVMALFPQQGAMYIAIYSIVDQFMLWTVGVNLTAPVEGAPVDAVGSAAAGASADGKRRGLNVRRIRQSLLKMVNPAMVAIVLGVAILLAGVPLPGFLNAALTATGAAATPLAMVYLGGMFCFIKLTDYLKRGEIYLMIAFKMVALPLAVYAVLSHIPAVDAQIAVTISLICALPTMSAASMMAEAQHGDGEYASGMIFVTTLVSAVTVPIVCALL